MKRLVLALLALALLAPVALARTGGGAEAQIGAAGVPTFEHETLANEDPPLTYLLDAGSDGSSTAIAIGTPAFTAGTITGGTDVCSENYEVARATADFGITGASTGVFTVGSDCAITYTGGATASTITATRVGWAIQLYLRDGVDANGNADATTVDDQLNVFVKIVDASTDLAAVKALYDGAGGASWTNRANWRFRPAESFTFTGTAGTASNHVGYFEGQGSSTVSPSTFTRGSTTYTVRVIAWRTSLNFFRFGITPNSGSFAGFTLRVGSAASAAFPNPSAFNFSGGTTGYNFLLSGIASNPMTSGSAYSATLSRAGDALASNWHGVTLTSGRLTGLNLDNNNLTGAIPAGADAVQTARTPALRDLNKLTSLNLGNNAFTGSIPAGLGELSALTSLDLGVDDGAGSLTGTIPAALGRLTSLTSLDLKGHVGLTGSIPDALTNIPGLTNLRLDGTNVCVNPATETDIVTWINAIRGRSGGVAIVNTCGRPERPVFTDGLATVTRGLESDADGSSTAIEVGRLDFSLSGYLGASAATHTCAVASANDNASNDPADHATTGAARTGFTAAVSGSACVVSYEGSGVTAAPGTLEAVSLVLSLSDGVDEDLGTIVGPASATIHDAQLKVHVKLRGTVTDGDALNALHAAAGGASWTTDTGWTAPNALHTWQITAGSSGNFRGFRASGLSNNIGSLRNNSGSFTLNGRSYTTDRLYQRTSDNRVFLGVRGSSLTASDFTGGSFRVGTATSTLELSLGVTSGTLSIQIDGFPAGTIGGSGNYDVVLQGTGEMPATLTSGSTWHGVTLTSGRVTALALPSNGLAGAADTALAALPELDQLTSLDLSGNTGLTGDIPGALLRSLTGLVSLDLAGVGWTGAIPTELDSLTALTTLDLSGNAALTASRTRLEAMAAALTNLTTLDLSDTGICVDPANAQHAALVTWVNGIRAKNTNTGVARVDTCGTPADPAFTGPAAVTRGLESGTSGAGPGNAIAIGTFAYTPGGRLGVTAATHGCIVVTAIDNPSPDPANHLTMGTARQGFTAARSGNACVVTYNGAGVNAAAGTLEAVSLVLGVGDGVDHEAGTLAPLAFPDPPTDDTINLTVKLRGTLTDGAALSAIHAAAGGAAWTNDAGWRAVIHTFELTAAASGAYTGYRASPLTPAVGSVRNSSDAFTVNSTSYTAVGLYYDSGAASAVTLAIQPATANALDGMRLRIGSNAYPESTHATAGTVTSVRFSGVSGGSPIAAGNFSAVLEGSAASPATLTASSVWHGVTLTSGRVTGLDLSSNGLAGAAATVLAQLAELDQLTSLDLSGNTGLTGAIPASLGAVTSLASLDLSGVGWTGAIPTELDDLTALTTLDLSGNPALTAGTARLEALLTALTNLTTLDLSGTGICLTRDAAGEADIRTRIESIRGGGTGNAVKVDTCGASADPSFAADAVSYELASGADGSTTAIAIGTPALALARGTHWDSGVTVCAIADARIAHVNDRYTTWSGYPNASGDLAIDSTTCAITYTGTGVTALDNSAEAINILVTVSDGVNQADGTLRTSATYDDYIHVSVKLTDGQPTDHDALDALWQAAGGIGWTAKTGWEGALRHTWTITVGESSGKRGYSEIARGAAFGSKGGGAFTERTGINHELGELSRNASGTLLIATQQRARGEGDFRRLLLDFSTGYRLNFTDRTTFLNAHINPDADFEFLWDGQPAAIIPATGETLTMRVMQYVERALPTSTTSGMTTTWSTAWHGVTVDTSSGRVTGLALADNNLAGGPLPASLNELTQLTALDLSGNAGLTGDFPAFVTDLANLATLNLNGVGFTGSIPAGLGSLTSLTALDLGGNALSGAVPLELEALTALTTLDLSDNAGLTATPAVLEALAEDLGALTTLDLSGTGICADPTDPDQSSVDGWIRTIRTRNTNMGVAKVATCGSPAAAAFTAESVILGLADGASGSGTGNAITVGTPSFRQATYAGARTGAACAITSARTNGSDEPGMWSATGGTDVSGDFAIDAATCRITYTGTGLASVDGTLEAVSIGVSVTDNLDPANGVIDNSADDTIEVTVKLVGLATDRAALIALYGSAGGSGWTTSTGGWTTAGSTLSSSWHGATVSGTPSRLTALALPDNNLRGALPASFTDLTALTSLDLSGNAGLTGTIPAALGSLVALTSLDLSDGGWSGAIPAELGSLTSLASLDLSGNALTGEAPAALGLLTALTSLDLSGNALTDIHDDLSALTALTTLDLSENRLDGGEFGDIATAISLMTSLTSLDLSGNTGLSGSIPTALLTLNALESLDLSGTGVCVDPSTETAAETWLAAIRARNAGAGVARVTTCGTPAAPSFTAESLRGSLEAGADGSGTGNAIAVGTPTFTQGAYSGGTVATCSIVTAKQNSSYDPADFTTTGVDVTGFVIDGATCALTYTGLGLTSTTAQAAVSIVVGISDGVDPAEGALSDDADDTVQVTVKLVGLATDRIALLDLYGSAGGAGWTTSTGGWKGERVLHTIELTAGSGTVSGALGSGVGYQDPGVGSGAIGSVRNGRDVTVSGLSHRINRVLQLANGNVVFTDNQGLRPDSDWNGLSLRLGTTTLAFTSATTSGNINRHWTWTGQASGLIPASGNFDALIIQANPALSSNWDGATVSGTPSRLTALDLNNNGLAGTLPAEFADLSALTSLNLSGNAGLTGSIPATLGSLVALTSLDLSGSGWTGAIPAALGSLTALTTLDLSENALSGPIPSQLGSLTALTTLNLIDNAALGGDLSHLTGLTSLTVLGLTGTRLCVNPTEQPGVESWLNTLRGNSAIVVVRTCGSPNPPTLADDAATYLLDVGADGSSTAVPVGAPAFTPGTYSGGPGACSFAAVQNPSAEAPGDFVTGTPVTGFAVDSTNCAITWTGSSAPTRVVGTRVAVSILLNVRDGVNDTGGVDPRPDDVMRVTVKLVDLATDKLAIEALHDDANGASWNTRTGWKTSTLTGSWHGVTLTSGRLTGLALPDNGLSGRLPALLGDLSRLTSLDLSGNSGLTGGIPVEFARLRNVVSIDLRGTRVCARDIGGAVNAWLNGIRAKPGGSVYLGSCPSSLAPGGTAGITVAEEGEPSGLRYSLQLVCGASSFAISLRVGERYVATVPPDAACALTATDRQGATAVRGEFTGLSLAGDVVVTFVRGSDEDEDEIEVAMEAVEGLERTLVVGTAFARWQAAETPVAAVVEELELCVVAVYWWDARNQRWESWFPGAEGLGVNTLDALAEDGIYVFTTERRTADNCGLLADDEEEGAGDAAG